MLARVIALTILVMIVSPAFAEPEYVRFTWDGNYPHNKPALWDKSKGPLDRKNIAAGWSNYFNAGSPSESNRIEKSGELEGTLYRAANGPTPFVIWMHGCNGLPKVVEDWTVDLAKLLNDLGIGVLVPNSHSRRFVLDTCGSPDPHWGRRRADDAGSALDYLIANKLAKRDQVYVMGQSNGGLTSLTAVTNQMLDRKNRFAAAFAMEPQCGTMQQQTFYAPIFFLLAEQDDANQPGPCIELAKKRHRHPMQVVVMKGAFHSYMFKIVPTTVTYGQYTWRSGHDERAAKIGMEIIAAFFQNPTVNKSVEFK